MIGAQRYICDRAAGCGHSGCHWHSPQVKLTYVMAFCSTADAKVFMMPLAEGQGTVTAWPDLGEMSLAELLEEIEGHVLDLRDLARRRRELGKMHMMRVHAIRLHHAWVELKVRRVLDGLS